MATSHTAAENTAAKTEETPDIESLKTLADILNDRLAATDDLAERMRLIADEVPGRVAFSTSLSLEDQSILHAIAEVAAGIDVFTLDTGRHFPETLETLAASEQRYKLNIRVLAPHSHETEALVQRDGVFGFRLSIDARKACCHVRKVVPLKRGLAGAAGWVTGMRRGQSAGRSDVPFASWDSENALIKFNPIADWSVERMDAFIAEHDIPVNPLHARGFPSIGCQPCTRAIQPGEDIRAGRWWWENPETKECGLHKHEPSPRKAG